MESRTCFSCKGVPLKTYPKWVVAQRAAVEVFKLHYIKLTPYKCTTCHEYHLEPKAHGKTCICCDGNGSRKDLYETREEARRVADDVYRMRGIRLNVYRCDSHKGYHLTKARR